MLEVVRFVTSFKEIEQFVRVQSAPEPDPYDPNRSHPRKVLGSRVWVSELFWCEQPARTVEGLEDEVEFWNLVFDEASTELVVDTGSDDGMSWLFAARDPEAWFALMSRCGLEEDAEDFRYSLGSPGVRLYALVIGDPEDV